MIRGGGVEGHILDREQHEDPGVEVSVHRHVQGQAVHGGIRVRVVDDRKDVITKCGTEDDGQQEPKRGVVATQGRDGGRD